MQKVGAEVAASLELDRSFEHTAHYAAACKEAAAELGVPCVDLFEGLQQAGQVNKKTVGLCCGLCVHVCEEGLGEGGGAGILLWVNYAKPAFVALKLLQAAWGGCIESMRWASEASMARSIKQLFLSAGKGLAKFGNGYGGAGLLAS